MKHVSMQDRLQDYAIRAKDLADIFGGSESLQMDPLLRVKLLSRLEILEPVLEQLEAEFGERLNPPGMTHPF